MRSAERKESGVRSQESEYGDSTEEFSCYLLRRKTIKVLLVPDEASHSEV